MSLHPAPIVTPRLTLLNITAATVRAEQAGLDDLTRSLGTPLAPEWPPEPWEPHVLVYLREKWEQYPESAGWNRYIALNGADGLPALIIGGVGTTVPLEEMRDANSTEVEIGYSLVPAFHRQSYAPEAVAAFTGWLFNGCGFDVQSICAQTFPELRASIRVLEKNGFESAGAGVEERTILYRKQKGRP